MAEYIVATIKPWNIVAFQERTLALPGTWHLVEHPEDLTLELVERLRPRYIFSPHWSWKVPGEVLSAAECVCFHMTDVPYGRGGSPLQNLIVHGHTKTRVSALRMVAELDAGPVYLKRQLDLSGSAQEIFERLSALVFDMIEEIVGNNPEPVPQTDEPVVFNRRTPAQSVLPAEGDLKKVYDHIRMLDAETYPRAFLENGDYRLEFSHARLCEDGALWATVTITEKRRDEK